jgi:hypothetical protein
VRRDEQISSICVGGRLVSSTRVGSGAAGHSARSRASTGPRTSGSS